VGNSELGFRGNEGHQLEVYRKWTSRKICSLNNEEAVNETAASLENEAQGGLERRRWAK